MIVNVSYSYTVVSSSNEDFHMYCSWGLRHESTRQPRESPVERGGRTASLIKKTRGENGRRASVEFAEKPSLCGME
jgi:hypothetical protein